MRRAAWAGAIGFMFAIGWIRGQEPARFESIQSEADGSVQLRLSSAAGNYERIEVSTDLNAWTALATARSTGEVRHTDAGASFHDVRYYRAVRVEEPAPLTGDHLSTTEGDLVIHPINHASFVMRWNGRMIYNDPVGGSGPYAGLASPDLVLVSHTHGDHFHAVTLNALVQAGTTIVAPQAVYTAMPDSLRALTTVLTNGASASLFGLTVEAVPAYNANHPRGSGNGYVLTLGGRRIYMSGDTGDVAEMRALADIDVAFLCMNLPFTMSINQAASAVRDFRPGVVYPYHYRNQDGSFANLGNFKTMVGTDVEIEIRLRTWY